MSVAAAVKNAILMLLIIFILHFLIKNIHLERRAQAKAAEPCVPYIAIEAKFCPEQEELAALAEQDEPDAEVYVPPCGDKDDHRDELQRFVYEEHTDLEKYFVPVAEEYAFETMAEPKLEVLPKKEGARVDALSFLNEYKPEKVEDDLMAYDSFGSSYGSAS